MTAERPGIDSYFMNIAIMVSSRTTCMRRNVGSVIVKGKQIVSTGYNGAPQGMSHCLDVGCARENVPSGERSELCRGAHAEQNAIVQAAAFGVGIQDSTLYCSHFPCVLCTKMLINAGITRVVAMEGYPDELATELLAEAGIPIDHITPPNPTQ